MWTVHYGDCLDELKILPDDSVDAVVTDPPYALDFMGKGWDKFEPEQYEDWCYQWALECLRVLKPGGFLLACGGTRTYHRLTSGIEDAGFEIRDSLIWLHGQGFPKNLDVSKAIDKAAGAEREITRPEKVADNYRPEHIDFDPRASSTTEAQQWAGWGTALKPSHEPIVMARKPFKGTVAANVLHYGTGAINIDACRVGSEPRVNQSAGNKPNSGVYQLGITGMPPNVEAKECQGRWPANVVLSHSADCVATGTKQVKTSMGKRGGSPDGNGIYGGSFPRGNNQDVGYADADGTETVDAYDCADNCPVAELDRQSGQTVSRKQPKTERRGGKATNLAMSTSGQTHEDSGGASRFFMQCAPDCPVAELDRQSGQQKSVTRKPTGKDSRGIPDESNYHVRFNDTQERGFSDQGGASRFFYCAKAPKSERPVIEGVEGHPTVKPLALMRWLVRMVCPPGGLILDPFAGTGTTAEAALLEGFDSVLIESDPVSIQRIEKRMGKYLREAA